MAQDALHSRDLRGGWLRLDEVWIAGKQAGADQRPNAFQ